MRRAQARREVELAAVALFAFHPDFATHHLHQPRRNSQPQFGTPILPVVDESAWENGAKITSRFPSGIPIPVSDTNLTAQRRGQFAARPGPAFEPSG